MSRPRKTAMEKMSESVLHCAVNQRHIRRSQPTREAALRDACSQLREGHALPRAAHKQYEKGNPATATKCPVCFAQ
jgi:hypothetical protein